MCDDYDYCQFMKHGVTVLQIMPIENAMRKPSHFLGCPSVLNIGMAVVCSMLMIVGFLGYLRYGDQVEVNVTLNLPQDM